MHKGLFGVMIVLLLINIFVTLQWLFTEKEKIRDEFNPELITRKHDNDEQQLPPIDNDKVPSANHQSLKEKINHLSHLVNGLNIKVTSLTKLLNDNRISSDSRELSVSKPSLTDHELTVLEQTVLEQNNETGYQAVESILNVGSIDQAGVHQLREKMANMSPEQHQKALHKLIMAINRGEVEVLPGTVF